MEYNGGVSHAFYRDMRAPPPALARGDGVYLYDSTGKQYLDGSGGAAVSCLGHSNAAVAAAASAQLQTAAYAHTQFFTSAPAEELAEQLAARAPGSLNRIYFTCGGSEAVEAALKLARQYFMERGEPERQHIIGRWQSYHGNTLGALAVGGNKKRRGLYEPLLFAGARHIAPCHHWRYAQAGEGEAEYGERVAAELEGEIAKLGEGKVAAFIAETVAGATLGAVAATPNYFKRIREICDRHGVLLILDEVMCGSGRCGNLFTCEQEGITPDILCMAKGLGAGVLPLGATICGEEIYQTIKGGAGAFAHGHTYHAHPTACAAGCAVLQEFDRLQLLPQVGQKGEKLQAALQGKLGGHANVGSIRGRGLFWGVEFVANLQSKAPLPPQQKTFAKIQRAAFARGLVVYALGGCADGDAGDHILLAPPYIVEDSHIEEIVAKLAAAVDEVLGAA